MSALAVRLARARAEVADLDRLVAEQMLEYHSDPAYLCGECGTIARRDAFLAVRYDEDRDTLVLDESGEHDPTLRCPACGHDHRDDDSGAGLYGDTVGQCLDERDRLLAERTEAHSVDWQDVWLDRWDAVASEREGTLR